MEHYAQDSILQILHPLHEQKAPALSGLCSLKKKEGNKCDTLNPPFSSALQKSQVEIPVACLTFILVAQGEKMKKNRSAAVGMKGKE